jgi:hypothetical protein
VSGADRFPIAGVVHLVRPLGVHAPDLAALREGIASAPAASLFHHVLVARLRTPRESSVAPDDFSDWVLGVVQDRETAERLAFAAHDAAPGPEPLRAALLAVLDAMPAAARAARVAPPDGAFAFLAAESVTLDTGLAAEDPAMLARLLAVSDTSAWFHHLVEQPWHDPRSGAGAWLRARGAVAMADAIDREVASARPFERVRERLLRAWGRGRLAHRLVEAAERPETVRRVVARSAVSGLARRLARGTGTEGDA